MINFVLILGRYITYIIYIQLRCDGKEYDSEGLFINFKLKLRYYVANKESFLLAKHKEIFQEVSRL